MAFATSYVSGRTLRDALIGTNVPNLSTNTIKAALFTDAVTAGDKNAVESYAAAPYNANEVANGSGYTTGGLTLPGCTISTPTAGKWVFDTTDVTTAWTTASFTARGVLIYNDTISPKRVLAAINFGSDRTVTAGTFTITWDATNGLFYSTF